MGNFRLLGLDAIPVRLVPEALVVEHLDNGGNVIKLLVRALRVIERLARTHFRQAKLLGFERNLRNLRTFFC